MDAARPRTILERQTQSELNLARIKYGARRAVTGIGRTFQERAWRTCSNKVRRSVNGVVEPDVDRIERVETLRERLESEAFREFKSA